jgi:hypothetical protein
MVSGEIKTKIIVWTGAQSHPQHCGVEESAKGTAVAEDVRGLGFSLFVPVLVRLNGWVGERLDS